MTAATVQELNVLIARRDVEGSDRCVANSGLHDESLESLIVLLAFDGDFDGLARPDFILRQDNIVRGGALLCINMMARHHRGALGGRRAGTVSLDHQRDSQSDESGEHF